MARLVTLPIYVNLRPNKDTVCFQIAKGFLWLWGRVLVKFNWILVFCLQLLFFGSLIFKFNHSKVYISSLGGASKPFLFIRLLPNVSYVIECICFMEISDFLNLSIFYIILVNILFILNKYWSILPPYRIQTNFVADCFNRWFSCFWYYEFSNKIFWFLSIFSPFCCCFCFFWNCINIQ